MDKLYGTTASMTVHGVGSILIRTRVARGSSGARERACRLARGFSGPCGAAPEPMAETRPRWSRSTIKLAVLHAQRCLRALERRCVRNYTTVLTTTKHINDHELTWNGPTRPPTLGSTDKAWQPSRTKTLSGQLRYTFHETTRQMSCVADCSKILVLDNPVADPSMLLRPTISV